MTSPVAAQVDRQPPLAWVILDRPELGNPVDEALATALTRVWVELVDEEIRAIGLRANGPAFSVGSVDRLAAPVSQFGPKSCGCAKPILAQVAGDVGAGAFSLIAEADVVIAAEDVHFTVPFDPVDRLDVLRLQRRLPAAELRRLALLGPYAALRAGRAQELGLVDEVVPRSLLAQRAETLLRVLARPDGELASWEAT